MMDEWIGYKNVCKIVKTTVSRAKLNKYDELRERLGTQEGERKIFLDWIKLEKSDLGTFKRFGV